jgi:parallel beta-helix repeat protein
MSRFSVFAALMCFLVSGHPLVVVSLDGPPTAVSSQAAEVVLPAAISQPGAYGAQWESDFRFFNPCGQDLDVDVEFQPENTDNVGVTLDSREFTLPANETAVYSDIFDLMPELEEGEVSGSLRIRSDSTGGCQVLLMSRTFNDTPDGTLGLSVPALPVEAPGEPFLDFPGLIHNHDYRSNLRLVNFSDTTMWVAVTALGADGVQVGEERSAKVFSRSTKQINGVAPWLGAPDGLSPFTVRVKVDGRAMQAVATVVDNTTGDSVLYTSSFADTSPLWLAGAASLSGVNESQWRTDLWLYNPTEDSLAGQSEFVVGSDPDQSYPFGWDALGARCTEAYLDVVSDELGLEETRGYIRLNGDGGGSAPQVAARTYNLDPVAGTYGLNLRAFGNEDLLDPGETGYIVGVSNSSDLETGFRTNLGMLNTESTWTTVRVTMFNLDGSFAAEPYETQIAPGKLIQFNVFNRLGLGEVDMTGSIRFDVISGGAAAVYATETDNRTQDSIFIPAQQATSPDGCNYIIDPATTDFESSGGSGSFSVVTDTECEWQVEPSQSWISITNGLSHAGSATVEYTVYPNSGTAREATISGGSARLRVTQDAMASEISVSLPGDIPMELVCIPAGTFQMGPPETERGRTPNETRHEVTLTRAYCLGKYEVTQGQWVAIMGSNPSTGDGVGDDYPVFSVSWDDITRPDGFLDSLNRHLEDTGQLGAGKFRLPTEAEWEMAVRAGTQTRFSFGDGLECEDDSCSACALYDQNMWWCGNTDDHAEPVGMKPPNSFGIYDMHGNIAEWVHDGWEEDLGTEPQTDPVAFGDDVRKVVRGGSYDGHPVRNRSASRADGYPDASSRTTGFRVARTLGPLTEITSCGQTVVTDAILVNDLECGPVEGDNYALRIGASNVTVDLGGHVISGHIGAHGIETRRIEWVTVKNGTLADFIIGIDSYRTRRARFEDLTIRNLESWDTEVFVSAMRITKCQDVVVKDSFFEFLRRYHKSGIHFADTEFTVDNLEMKNGGVGVDISGDCHLGTDEGSSGSVINSRFSGTLAGGVLVQCTENARVANNQFIDNETGVVVDTHAPGYTTGLTIEGNVIEDAFRGIHFWGTDGCSIQNNEIHRTAFGIYLDENMACPDEPMPDSYCFYATGNLISGNEVTGNYLDLFHHPNASGNTWVDNICETWEGAEIPGCIAP